MSSSKRNYQNARNEAVKTTYVPNMIGIPTYEVDLWHHGLQLVERNPKSPMESPQGERGGRKKEIR
jgi:hypothetical protein